MDRSELLVDLFERASPYVPQRVPFSTNLALQKHPLHRALGVVTEAVHRATRNAKKRITFAVNTLVDLNPSVTDAENKLLLSEAELLSVSTSIAEFTASIKEATAEVHRRRDESNSDAMEDGILLRGLDRLATLARETMKRHTAVNAAASTAEHGIGDNDESGGTSAPALPTEFLLEHYSEALGVLEAMLAKTQLTIALCREEVAQYKHDMHLYGRAGVLSYDPHDSDDESDAEEENRTRNVLRLRKSPGHNGGDSENDSDDGRGQTMNYTPDNFKMVALTRHTGTLVGDAFSKTKGVLSKVVMPVSSAASALEADIFGGDARAIDPQKRSAFSKGFSPAVAGSSTTSSAPPTFQYTEDELHHLEQENKLMLEKQNEVAVEDAKQIETSVRELSKLTLLMNQKLMEQSEQFTSILENTEKAHQNVDRGVEELKQPLNVFWNPTRQLIALVWICTLILLASNSIIR